MSVDAAVLDRPRRDPAVFTEVLLGLRCDRIRGQALTLGGQTHLR